MNVFLTDQLGDQRGIFGVRLIQPAAVGDAVCHVAEFFRHFSIEIVEYGLL